MGKIMQMYTILSHFRKDFCNQWGVVPYNNPNDPCLFFGVFTQRDIDAIRNHKGFKVVWFVNARGNQYIDKLQGVENIVFKSNPYLDVPSGMLEKDVSIAIKDYSMFTPTPLGDKVYCYIGTQADRERRGYSQLKQLEAETPFEFVYGFLKHNMEYVKENYYDKCFISINLTKGGGRTTARELGAMGRKTVMDTKYFHPAYITFRDKEHIKEIITQESKHIGSVPLSLRHDDDDTTTTSVGDRWLDVEFWTQ